MKEQDNHLYKLDVLPPKNDERDKLADRNDVVGQASEVASEVIVSKYGLPKIEQAVPDNEAAARRAVQLLYEEIERDG